MKHFTAFLLILCSSLSKAQDIIQIDELVKMKRTKIDRVEASNSSTTTLIPSSFSEEQLKSFPGLRDLTIVKVYYVYTGFRLNPGFDQHSLDKKRFRKLHDRYPELFIDPLIEWELLEQTSCESPATGSSFFHGFIIVHRPLADSKDREEEVRRLMAFLEDPDSGFDDPALDPVEGQLKNAAETTTTDSKKEEIADRQAEFKAGKFAMYEYLHSNIYSKEVVDKRKDLWVEVDVEVDEYGKIGQLEFKDADQPEYVKDVVSDALKNMPDWNPAISKGQAVSSDVNLSIRVSYSRIVSGMYMRDGVKPAFDEGELPDDLLEQKEKEIKQDRKEALKHSTVYRSMDLLNKDEKYALVMDVTGSMAPHIAALKRWLMSNPEDLAITSYSFYNDGDNKPTIKKKKGETGGIYMTSQLEKTTETIQEAMMNGSGGETSEADIEAVLFAIKMDTLCESVLLVADNYSDIRDFSLLKDVDRKVNVLLCAAPEAIRVEYLTLVKKTGGILLLNGEKVQLDSMKKGDKIVLQNRVYQYTGSGYKLKGKVGEVPGA